MNPAKVILENGLGGRKILYVCVTEKGFLSMRRQSEGFVAVLRPGVNRPVDVDRTSRVLSIDTSSKAVSGGVSSWSIIPTAQTQGRVAGSQPTTRSLR